MHPQARLDHCAPSLAIDYKRKQPFLPLPLSLCRFCLWSDCSSFFPEVASISPPSAVLWSSSSGFWWRRSGGNGEGGGIDVEFKCDGGRRSGLWLVGRYQWLHSVAGRDILLPLRCLRSRRLRRLGLSLPPLFVVFLQWLRLNSADFGAAGVSFQSQIIIVP